MDIPVPASHYARWPGSLDPLHSTRLSPGGYAQFLPAVKRWHFHGRAEDRLRDSERHLYLQVLTLPVKDGVGLDVRGHVQVAGSPTFQAGLT